MKEFLKNLFSDSPLVSMGRYSLFLTTNTACVVALIAIMLNRDLIATSALVSALVAFSTAGHVVRKKIERGKK